MQYKYLSQQIRVVRLIKVQKNALRCECSLQVPARSGGETTKERWFFIKEGESAPCSGCSRNPCPPASLASPYTPSSPLRPRPPKRKRSRKRRKMRKNSLSLRNYGRPEVSQLSFLL